MGSGRARRMVGVVVLAAALVLAFLVARGASFPQAGRPLAAWPQPPAVGTCQELDSGALHTVPCSESHGIEVTKTWQAIDTLPSDLVDACFTAADDYLGLAAAPKPVDGWQPDAPHYSAYQWSAPPADVVGGRGWTACLIAPWRPSEYTGSVRDLASPADRPAAYGQCGYTDGPTLVACDQPHDWEQLGQTTVDLGQTAALGGVADAAAAHEASCRKLAASLIGVADPTYGDRLQIVVDGQQGYSITISDQSAGATVTWGSGDIVVPPVIVTATTAPTAATTAPTTATPSGPSTSGRAPTTTPTDQTHLGPHPVAILTCQAIDAKEQLLGSLMGLGNRPLPVK